MTKIGYELVHAARSRIDSPFMYHFSPYDLCKGGRETLDYCMQRGLGPKGYDCSGLVLASLCDVLGLGLDKIPQEMRHATQIDELGSFEPSLDEAEPGDVLTLISPDPSSPVIGVHIGVLTSRNTMVHASASFTERVAETRILSLLLVSAVIPVGMLADRIVTGG